MIHLTNDQDWKSNKKHYINISRRWLREKADLAGTRRIGLFINYGVDDIVNIPDIEGRFQKGKQLGVSTSPLHTKLVFTHWNKFPPVGLENESF